MVRKLLFLTAVLMTAGTLYAAPVDSVAPSAARRGGFVKRVIEYLKEDSVEREANARKRFSVNLLGGPSYAKDSKFMLALAGVIHYRLDGCEYPMQPSSMTVSGTVSTAKFWSVGASGITLLDRDRHRLNTDIWLGYMPLDFWGLGYDMGADSQNKSKIYELKARVHFDYLRRVSPAFFIGPSIEWNYHNSGKMDRPELIEGQDGVVRNYGVGLTLQYDNRDLMTNASRGLYVYYGVLFRPKFLWNKYAFTTNDLRICYYHSAWTGCIIAGELRGLFNFGNPSWAMLARLGSNSSMRGYYQGRFRDKHMITGQVEFRQHVWSRSGLVAWVGCGSVFHDSESFKHWLPNYGIGYRFEFRNRMNIRFDYGFGAKGENGFMFSINEAF